jgi:signal transduction histidine kinase
MDKWQRFSINTPGAPLATAVRTGQPIWVHSQVEFLKLLSENTDPSLPDPAGFQGRAAVPLFVNGQAIGAIGLSFITPLAFNEADKRFIMTLARQCEQALERSQLHENAKALAAQEERQRIARDLHDSVSQTLFAASVTAESLPGVWKRDPSRMTVLLEHLHTLNRAAAAEMRVLLWELRPEVLESTSLTVLTSQLAYALKGRKAVQVTLDFDVEDLDSLPTQVQVAYYRIAQEAINNIVKHAQATSVTIALAALQDVVELRIIDNGRGFDPKKSPAGMGMTTMRERAERIGASLDVTSSDGNGTQVFVRWDRRNDAE